MHENCFVTNSDSRLFCNNEGTAPISILVCRHKIKANIRGCKLSDLLIAFVIWDAIGYDRLQKQKPCSERKFVKTPMITFCTLIKLFLKTSGPSSNYIFGTRLDHRVSQNNWKVFFIILCDWFFVDPPWNKSTKSFFSGLGVAPPYRKIPHYAKIGNL